MDAVEARPADLVLIGIHRANNSGAEATSLLLGLHPATVIIVSGSVDEIDVLAAAYIRGARGLIPWDPDQPPQHDKGKCHDTATLQCRVWLSR